MLQHLNPEQELDYDIRLRRELQQTIEFELRVSRLNTVIQVRCVLRALAKI